MAKLVELIVDKYDGSLKAEHGTGINMAPYVEREWGEKATELMWRVKRLADPDGVLAPGVVLNRDPGAHLRNLKTTPQIEEVGDDLRRVRLLRAGLPEPQPDDDAAPADRPAARDGAPAGRLAAPAGAARGVRVRRDRHLRRRRHLPARLPGRDRHRQAGQGAARRSPHGARPNRRRCGRRSGGARSRGRAAPASAVGGPRWCAAPSAAEGLPGARRRRCRGRRARAPPPSTSRPASTGSSAADGPGPACPRRSSPSRDERGSRSGSRPTSAGHCCGLPWSSKGYGEAHRRKANEMVERLWQWSGEGELPVVIDAASCTQAIADPRRRGPRRGERRAPRGDRGPRLDRLGPRSPPAPPRGHPPGRLGDRPPDLRDPPPGPGAAAPRPRRRPRRRGLRRRPRRPAAASPATAASPTRS